MDNTEQIIGIQKRLHALVGHEGWSVARDRLVKRIEDLQNAFSIEDKTEHEMFVDLKARKIASVVLFDWLRDIEGTADQFESNKLTLNDDSYIIRE